MRDAQLHLTKEIQRFIQESGGTCGYQANHVQESMSFDQRLPFTRRPDSSILDSTV